MKVKACNLSKGDAEGYLGHQCPRIYVLGWRVAIWLYRVQLFPLHTKIRIFYHQNCSQFTEQCQVSYCSSLSYILIACKMYTSHFNTDYQNTKETLMVFIISRLVCSVICFPAFSFNKSKNTHSRSSSNVFTEQSGELGSFCKTSTR